MNKFRETQSSVSESRINRKLNTLISISEIEAKNLPAHKSPGPESFTCEFYETFREELTPSFLKLFQQIQEEETQTLFMRPVPS